MRKYITFIILSVIGCASAFSGTVIGTVADSSDGNPLINASLKILNSRDSVFVNGGITNIDGKFSFRGLRKGNYILEVSYLGYKTKYTDFRITDASQKLSLDSVKMTSNTIILKEAEVVGVKTEVKVMQDTVEYNADSYKVQPNAVVEDLLKRLPGVEVDADGKITAQGKEITKILVDGEEFFTDDAKVASKNIPVDMVDKLQVIDRKSDLARLTGVDDGEEETVINLSVKKGMKKGWFGNAVAGYGTDDRYMGNFMVNRFYGKNQFSIIGNFNNINDPGFTNSGGRFFRFGSGRGINSAQSIGINFNVGKGTNFRIGGDLMYSHSNKKTNTSASKQYLFTDSTSYENSKNASTDNTHNIFGNFRIKWEADSSNTFDFRPRFNVSFNDSHLNELSQLFAGDANRTAVNKGQSNVVSSGTSYELSGELVYNRKFKKPGRSLSTQMTYRYSNTEEDETSYALNEFFLAPEENEERNQIGDNRQWTSRAGLRLTWKEPLGDIKKARFLTLAYNMNYYFNNADKLVYNIGKFSTLEALNALEEHGIKTNPAVANAIAEESGVLDEEQSNRFRNDQFDQRIRIGYQQNTKTIRLNAGFSVEPTMMQSENLVNSAKDIPQNWVWNYAPFIRFRYMFSKKSSLAVNYRGSSSAPSMKQLQPVADVSDPMKVIQGNPNLVPSFTHRIMLRYNNFNQDKQRSIMAMGNISFTQNSIVTKTTYEETGKQLTTYENVNGVWSAHAMAMFTTPFKNKNWHFSNHLFLRYSKAVGFTNGLINRSGSIMVSETPSLAFRNGLVDIELRPYYNLQLTRNSLQNNSDRNVHSYGATFNANYYAPFGLVLSTDLSYGDSKGYSDGFDNEQWLWNASISYQFLKGKNATVSVKAYDLLQEKKNISRTVTANYITDSEFNTITRYFMVTFAYKFSVFGNGATERDFDYGGYGRRPGPPHRMGGPH